MTFAVAYRARPVGSVPCDEALPLRLSSSRAVMTRRLLKALRRSSRTPLLVESQSRPEVFGAFYEQLYDQVLEFFARRTWDAEAAFDLTAETFARAYAYRQSFRGTTDNEAYAWLWTIARRQLADWYERGRVEREALDRLGLEPVPLSDPEMDRVEELADLPFKRAQIELALSRLPSDQQRAVRARILDGEAYGDIARETSVTEDVVRARVSRGLRTLWHTLESHDLK